MLVVRPPRCGNGGECTTPQVDDPRLRRSRVDRDGWIDWRGSTRTCREINSNGDPKTPGYAYAARGFAYWGRLTGEPWLMRKANAVYEFLTRHEGEGSFCWPKPSSTARAEQADRGGGTETLRGARLNDLLE